MSMPPEPPVRSLEKNSQCSSRDSAATASVNGVFTGGPMLAGAPHGSSSLARCDTQMSVEPSPPGRSEWKYRLNPSLETAAPASAKVELTGAPRLTGAVHAEYLGAAFGYDDANASTAIAVATILSKTMKWLLTRVLDSAPAEVAEFAITN